MYNNTGVSIMAIKILIAEDEYRIRRLVKDYLKREEFEIIEAENGQIALEKFYEEKFDLLILDIMMPELDGWKVCKTIRKDSDIPIIMLTAKSEEEDHLRGYDIGASEYIAKPFSPKILVAKVKSILNMAGKLGDLMEIEDYKIDLQSRKFYKKDEDIELTSKEFDLILYFINNKGIALSREKILDKVWGFDYFGDLRTVDTHIKRLRKKISGIAIQTVRGFGYRYGD